MLKSTPNLASPTSGENEESNEDFRKELVRGLWSVAPYYRLHIADASTNTPLTRDESGYESATSPDATPPTQPPSSSHYSQPLTPLTLPPTTAPNTHSSEYSACCDSSACSTGDDRSLAEAEDERPLRESVSTTSIYAAGRHRSFRHNNHRQKHQQKHEQPPSTSSPLPPSHSSNPVVENVLSKHHQRKRNNSSKTTTKVSKLAQDYDYVIGIDIGTRFTGWAYARVSDYDSNRGLRTPTIHNGESTCPSALLLTPNGSFHCFGRSAMMTFHDMTPSEAKRFSYFENFKANIVLPGFQEPNKESSIQASNGLFVPALSVFSQVLAYIKTRAINNFHQQHTSSRVSVNPDRIMWVISVPYFWSQEAKDFIKEAAKKGGLGCENKTDSIRLAIDPETVAVYAWQMSHQCSIPSVHTPGSSFVSLNCGAGSVYAGVHQVSLDGKSLTELTPIKGGPRGDLAIDLAFEVLLCEIFSADFIKHYQRLYPVRWLELMREFGRRKRTVHPEQVTPMNITLPPSFVHLFRKKSARRVKVETAVRKFNDPDIMWCEQGVLRLGENRLWSLFEPTINGIIDYIETTISTLPITVLPTLQSIYLLGAFPSSPILTHRIKQHFGHQFKVITDNDGGGGGGASAAGCVLLGLNPELIGLRRSQMSYGMAVLHPFDPAVHPPGKLIYKRNMAWCMDVYEELVAVGEAVPYGHSILRRYSPASNEQSQLLITLYSSRNPNSPAFVTDAGVRQCIRIRVDLTAISGETDRQIEIRIRFDVDNVRMTAHHPQNPNQILRSQIMNTVPSN